ncbi:MAG: prevent-host-death family protein [Acidobacteriales bacterium]|nr:prevent-host-death family protein [Terriglobales bacterium]
MKINIHDAKTNFSKLLRRVASGEEITIAQSGVPVARLVPVDKEQSARKLGLGSGTLKIADDFDAPLPRKVLDSFYRKSAKKRV